jgi:hypothetical protein
MTDYVKKLKEEKERHNQKISEENKRHSNRKNKILEESGYKEIINAKEFINDEVSKLYNRRTQFRDDFFKFVYLITESEPISIGNMPPGYTDITIKQDGIYRYNTSKLANLERIVTDKNNIDTIRENIENKDDRKRFNEVIEVIKSQINDMYMDRLIFSIHPDEFVIFEHAHEMIFIADRNKYRSVNESLNRVRNSIDEMDIIGPDYMDTIILSEESVDEESFELFCNNTEKVRLIMEKAKKHVAYMEKAMCKIENVQSEMAPVLLPDKI